MNLKKTVISLFTGGGGLDLGFEAAGFEVKLAVDTMPESIDTLKLNFPNLAVLGPNDAGDVTQLEGKDLLKAAKLKVGECDVMIGGPPCQPFSMAAAQRFWKSDEKFKRKGFECEDKGQLVFHYARLIKEVRPKVFLIENVPGILSIDGGSGISVVYEMLEKEGYTISKPFVVDAKSYGVPQSRKRAFVVGTLNEKVVNKPEPTHALNPDLLHLPYATVAQALYGMSNKLPNSETREHKADSIMRYKTLKFGEREQLGRVDRLDPLKPSKTVIAGGSNGGGRSHLHPYEARTMSVRECARLQTFPDDYKFLGKNGRQFTQVGNAVPPLLAEVMARQISKDVFGKVVKGDLQFAVKIFDAEEANKFLKAKSILEHKQLVYNDIKKSDDVKVLKRSRSADVEL
ncbi:DNA cytosine methyltransferase [Bdellovibrio sp. qaytius]|nr:DNA cytosine methyltransferase [Bdellovibrio sp. qaytius]